MRKHKNNILVCAVFCCCFFLPSTVFFSPSAFSVGKYALKVGLCAFSTPNALIRVTGELAYIPADFVQEERYNLDWAPVNCRAYVYFHFDIQRLSGSKAVWYTVSRKNDGLRNTLEQKPQQPLYPQKLICTYITLAASGLQVITWDISKERPHRGIFKKRLLILNTARFFSPNNDERSWLHGGIPEPFSVTLVVTRC